MKAKQLAGLFIIFSFFANAQDKSESLFNRSAPLGSVTFSDLKTALKTPAEVYKLDLANSQIDDKSLKKIGKLDQLQSLQFGNNNMSVFPEEMCDLTSLVYLGCYGNNLKSLPKNMFKLESLTYFELFNIELDSFNCSAGYLPRLKKLSIQNNKADTFKICKSIGMLMSLDELTITGCNIDTLPAETGNIKHLRGMNLSNAGLKFLPKELGQLNELKALVLDNNKLTKLPNELYKLKKLEYLSLRNNRGFMYSDHICYLKNLETLDLRGCGITEYDAAVLRALLPQCKILR